MIQKNCERVIRGNWDVFINSPADNEFIQWFKDRLTVTDYQYLKSLPFNIDLELNGQLIRFFHASPRSEFERIFPSHPIEKRLSMFDNSESVQLQSNDSNRPPDIVFYGDIHVAFLHTYEQGILFNVGSVGNPLDLRTASYIILDTSHSTNAIQFVRVDYDRSAELAISEEMGLPALDKYHDEIMFGKYRGS